MNKTKHYILPILLAALCLITACSDDDGSGTEGNVVRLAWGVMESDGLTSLTEGMELGIFLHNVAAGDTVLYNESFVVDKNGEPHGLPTLYADSTYTLHAIHPYLQTLTTINASQTFAVADDQSPTMAFDYSDLLIGSTTIDGTMAQMQLNHLLTRVIVHVTDLTGRNDLLHIDSLTSHATLSNMATTVTFSLQDGLQNVLDRRTDITMWLGNRTDYRLSAMAIVPPQQLTEGQSIFSLSFNGREVQNCVIPAVAYEGGKTYVYKLNLTNDGLIPDGTYVTGWTGGNGGELQGE